MAVIEATDIMACKGGVFRSLRDGAIAKNGFKTFGTGSGIFYNGNWYLLKDITPPPPPASGGTIYADIQLLNDLSNAGSWFVQSVTLYDLGRNHPMYGDDARSYYVVPANNQVRFKIEHYGGAASIVVPANNFETYLNNTKIIYESSYGDTLDVMINELPEGYDKLYCYFDMNSGFGSVNTIEVEGVFYG